MKVISITKNPKITTETPKSAAFLSATLILFLYLDKNTKVIDIFVEEKPTGEIMQVLVLRNLVTHKVSMLLVRVTIFLELYEANS